MFGSTRSVYYNKDGRVSSVCFCTMMPDYEMMFSKKSKFNQILLSDNLFSMCLSFKILKVLENSYLWSFFATFLLCRVRIAGGQCELFSHMLGAVIICDLLRCVF